MKKVVFSFIVCILILSFICFQPALAERVSKTIKLGNGDVDLDEIAVNEKTFFDVCEN